MCLYQFFSLLVQNNNRTKLNYLKFLNALLLPGTDNLMNIIHNHKRVMYNKLFPLPPSKSYNNLMIDDEAVSFITTPANSETITAIIDSHIPDYVMRSDVTILDGTACVGGDSIAFGKNFGSVIASEIDERRYYMLTNNLKEYELYNVVPVNTDCLKILKRVNFINIMYFDPPWGGKQYKAGTNLRLSIGDFYVDELIDTVFDETKQPRSDVQMVVLKLPKNYDLYTLYNNTKHRSITLYLYDLPKMYVVVAMKNDAWKNF